MFVTAYDVRDEGIGSLRIVFLAIMAALMVSLVIGLLRNRSSQNHTIDDQRKKHGCFACVGCIMYTLVVVTGFSGAVVVTIQRWQAIRFADDGNYETVEGIVRDYATEHARGQEVAESFKVGRASFHVDSRHFSAGLNRPAATGGPIRPGLHVRIGHRDGRILRVEVRQ